MPGFAANHADYRAVRFRLGRPNSDLLAQASASTHTAKAAPGLAPALRRSKWSSVRSRPRRSQI